MKYYSRRLGCPVNPISSRSHTGYVEPGGCGWLNISSRYYTSGCVFGLIKKAQRADSARFNTINHFERENH